ncbi:MAG TPA: hypothetical protein VHK88_19105 [Aquihabitans sp.]|jgi:hypothetical protein|nr:hypothetical protein [Aquihabitans sp.]
MVVTVQGRKPGRIGFWVGGALIAIGFVFGAILLVDGVRSMADTVEGYQRVPLPEGGAVLLDEPGTYRVYFEADGADEGAGSPGAVTILDPSGERLMLEADAIDETYALSGFTGRKIGSFRAAVAGRYELRTVLTDGGGAGSSRAALAVGRRSSTGSVLTILGGVFGGLAILAVGVVVLIVSGVRRGRANAARYAGAPMPGWGEPVGGPPGWGPPGSTAAPGVPWSPPGTTPGWAPPVPGPVAGGPPGWTPPGGPPSTLPPVPAPGSWSRPHDTAPVPPPPPPAPAPEPPHGGPIS